VWWATLVSPVSLIEDPGEAELGTVPMKGRCASQIGNGEISECRLHYGHNMIT
jgi:hypothetical protein